MNISRQWVFPLRSVGATLVLMSFLFFVAGCAAGIHQPMGPITTQKAPAVPFDTPSGTFRVTEQSVLKTLAKTSYIADSRQIAAYLHSEYAQGFAAQTLSSVVQYMNTDQPHGFGQLQVFKLNGTYSSEDFSRRVASSRQQIAAAQQLSDGITLHEIRELVDTRRSEKILRRGRKAIERLTGDKVERDEGRLYVRVAVVDEEQVFSYENVVKGSVLVNGEKHEFSQVIVVSQLLVAGDIYYIVAARALRSVLDRKWVMDTSQQLIEDMMR